MAENVKLTRSSWSSVRSHLVAIFFSPELNNIVIYGFPMGYYMGAQDR